MKHLRLFENKSVKSIKSALIEYSKTIDYLRPMFNNKYEVLANNPNYNAEYGDKPDPKIDAELMILHEINCDQDGVEAIFYLYDRHDEICNEFNIFLTDEEIKRYSLEFDAKKYNL